MRRRLGGFSLWTALLLALTPPSVSAGISLQYNPPARLDLPAPGDDPSPARRAAAPPDAAAELRSVSGEPWAYVGYAFLGILVVLVAARAVQSVTDVSCSFVDVEENAPPPPRVSIQA
tara:strand:+ start:2986 stop:3339 length:354 start_codon:yes stop_codon:yes gene_type:complete